MIQPFTIWEKLTFSWERFPALYIFASMISGALLHCGVPIPLVFALSHKKHSFKIGYVCLAIAVATLFSLDNSATPPEEKLYVKAYIQPIKIIKSGSRLYLSAFIPYLKTAGGKEYKKLSCLLPLYKKSKPAITSDFLVEGTLKKSSYGYFLQPKKWVKMKHTISYAEKRFALKNRARSIIDQNHLDNDVSNYFSALTTGNISDPFIKQRFLAAGMLHTLAISGFHFSWVIFLLSIPLSLLLPKKTTLCLLLILSWGYFFFLGPSSSISRAWIAISVYLASLLFSEISLPLNALGLAGICSMVIDPYCIFTLSFALSFLATFCILTTHSFTSSLVEKVCSRRNKKSLKSMRLIDKYAYYLLRIFLSSFFLSLVIQVFLLPVFCYNFPLLSLWGLFYNIFFPLSMIPTLILLLLAFALHPFISTTLIWKINAFYSKPLLEALLYGNGWATLLIKLPDLSLGILTSISTLLILPCMLQEKIAHEEHLIRQDEFLLT